MIAYVVGRFEPKFHWLVNTITATAPGYVSHRTETASEWSNAAVLNLDMLHGWDMEGDARSLAVQHWTGSRIGIPRQARQVRIRRSRSRQYSRALAIKIRDDPLPCFFSSPSFTRQSNSLFSPNSLRVADLFRPSVPDGDGRSMPRGLQVRISSHCRITSLEACR